MPQFTRRNLLATVSLAVASQILPQRAYSATEESSMNALKSIRAIDYTVIFARDMAAMRSFYENTMGFTLKRELSPQWVEYSVGSQILALTEYGMMWSDIPTPDGQLSLQLAFRVTPQEVHACSEELESKGIEIIHPVMDQSWGHRTLFFGDPDGNVLEIYADI